MQEVFAEESKLSCVVFFVIADSFDAFSGQARMAQYPSVLSVKNAFATVIFQLTVKKE